MIMYPSVPLRFMTRLPAFLLSLTVWLLATASLTAHAAIPVIDSQGNIPSLAPLLGNVTPAVVNISVQSRAAIEENPLFRDPFFRRFFNMPDQATRPERSAGSGVIVDAGKGYILTNHHVIKNAQHVIITLKDHRQFPAKLVGTDPGTDIALLRIDARNLQALRFGDSDNLNVGDFVVAIGNPFGLGQTVTSGIVSALGRSGLGIEGYEDFIQTDASINPGNSGGALINLRGELVGINTAIIGPSGGNVGIGFAVPSAMAKAVMSQLASSGEVRRGRLGASTEDITHELATSLGLHSTDGSIISAVEPGSPAEKAGIRPRDIVTAVNSRAVRNAADLRNKIGLMPVGETVEIKLIRNGRLLAAKVQIARPLEVSATGGESVPQLAGASITNLTPDSPLYGKVHGIQVVRVETDSPAWQHGVRPGDMIIGVNRRKIRSVQEFLAALKNSDNTLILNLLRGDFQLTIYIR